MISIKTPTEINKDLSSNYCPECGEEKKELAEEYLQECDRCLSKAEE